MKNLDDNHDRQRCATRRTSSYHPAFLLRAADAVHANRLGPERKTRDVRAKQISLRDTFASALKAASSFALVGILHRQACAPMPHANTQLCA
jgi:hypothetical protein